MTQMFRTKAPARWNKLDNAAKIFPPTSTKRDTKVFRFACELREQVNPELLQQALDRTMGIFPLFHSVLKRGLFWYYLEESELLPVVRKEADPICSAIYDANTRRLLFEVTYYRRRISLEVYHSLSDGTGALHFLRVLVYHYLLLAHPGELGEAPPAMVYDASPFQSADDSFEKYYEKNRKRVRVKKARAYKLRGAKVPENRIQLIEGVLPVAEAIEKAHEYGGTLTSFITAALMCSIADTMSLRDKCRRPVVVTLPVNLRQFFFSESARNFFSVFEAAYDFGGKSTDLAEVTSYLTEFFRQELNAERMGERMNALAAIEHNMAARLVPCVLKDFFLRQANRLTDKTITAAVSNVGKVDMPDEFASYIRLFDVFVSTERLQICMCSYGGNLTVSFTSAFENTEVQKNFFRLMTGMGISVAITCPPEEVDKPDGEAELPPDDGTAWDGTEDAE